MTLATGTLSPEARIARAGLRLPHAAPEPIGAFSNLRSHRGLLYVSGQGPVLPDGTLKRGKVGATVTAEEARAAGGFARLINQGRASGESAGIAQLVFSTEERRREVVAFARRCRSRLLRKTLRLHRVRE
jgi:hypothetical protein